MQRILRQERRLAYLPCRFFSNELKEVESETKAPAKVTESKNYLDYLKFFPSYLLEETYPAPYYHKFHNREIFSTKVDPNRFKAAKRSELAMGVVMFGASIFSYLYINPLIMGVPIWFLSGNVVSYFSTRRMERKLCTRLFFNENGTISVTLASGREFTFKVGESMLIGLKEWSPLEEKEDNPNNYVMMADFMDVKGKSHMNIQFIVDGERTKIENLDLFKAIIKGDAEEVAKYKYVGESTDEQTESQE